MRRSWYWFVFLWQATWWRYKPAADVHHSNCHCHMFGPRKADFTVHDGPCGCWFQPCPCSGYHSCWSAIIHRFAQSVYSVQEAGWITATNCQAYTPWGNAACCLSAAVQYLLCPETFAGNLAAVCVLKYFNAVQDSKPVFRYGNLRAWPGSNKHASISIYLDSNLALGFADRKSYSYCVLRNCSHGIVFFTHKRSVAILLRMNTLLF